MHYQVNGYSVKGSSHIKNEDSFYFKVAEQYIWLAVFDGVSEGGNGEIASGLAREVMTAMLNDITSGINIPKYGLAILSKAQNEIISKQQESEELARISTTAVIACIDTVSKKLHWFSIGDSALFICGKTKTPVKLTVEDSANGYLLAKGKISVSEAKRMYVGNALDWCLGKHVETEELIAHVHYGCAPVKPQDTIMVCSDGLYSYLPPKYIGRILRKGNSIEKRNTMLIQSAKKYGSRDDITVICAVPDGGKKASQVPISIALAAIVFFFALGFLCGTKLSFQLKGNDVRLSPINQEAVQMMAPLDTLTIIPEENETD